MESIIAVQAVAGVVYLTTITVVGIRLLMLARRTRALPELLMGLALLLGGTFAGPLEAAAVALREEVAGTLAGRLLCAGKLFGFAALSCQATFVWRVFRPQARWAVGVVVAVLVFPLVGMFGYALNGAFATAEVPMFWFWIDLTGRCTTSFWLIAEGFRYYQLMKRRLSLGLADPVVTNRFLLWTIAGGVSLVLLLSAVPPMVLDGARHAHLLALDLVVFSAAGVAISVLYLLTFFPPESYRRRLVKAAEAAQ